MCSGDLFLVHAYHILMEVTQQEMHAPFNEV